MSDNPEVEDIQELEYHQLVFDELLSKYSGGMEPLENWGTQDLLTMANAIEAELQNRSDETVSTLDRELDQDVQGFDEHVSHRLVDDDY
jgi:hypothetical protein